ncbi:MAG TPA: hypothetical protein VIK10_08860 [Prolixibacteraceae bacterium]
MKKIKVLHAGFIAVGALSVGLLIGLWVAGVFPAGDSMVGTFGKADKYRKVSMTEKDIILRNDLLGDTASLSRNQKYLSYFYFKSLQTSIDIEKAVKKTANEADFNKTNYAYANSLVVLNTYLETARIDLLKGISVLKTLKESENLPVTDDLIKAGNAISRIRYHDRILSEYLNSVETYLANHTDQTHQGLKDAYDLLTINVMQTAMINKDKPMLKYLGEKKFYNDRQGINALLAEVQLSSEINAMVAHDKIEISGMDEKDSRQMIDDINKLDRALGGAFVLNRIGLPVSGALKNNADRYPLPDLGEIIRIQEQIIQAFAVTDMQRILDQALLVHCAPACAS